VLVLAVDDPVAGGCVKVEGGIELRSVEARGRLVVVVTRECESAMRPTTRDH
jgi:hypothetical protein